MFAECRPTWHSAKAVALADPKPATWQACAECLALGKGGSFGECLTAGHLAKGTATDAVCPGLPLPSAPLCRVRLFVECQTLGKEIFAECGVWHSEEPLCRVLEVCHSTKVTALGKAAVSRSDLRALRDCAIVPFILVIELEHLRYS
jgi:hypothetical protein